MAISRSTSRSSTFRNDRGYFTYIVTTSRITSGDEVKQRNGLGALALDLRLIYASYSPPGAACQSDNASASLSRGVDRAVNDDTSPASAIWVV